MLSHRFLKIFLIISIFSVCALTLGNSEIEASTENSCVAIKDSGFVYDLSELHRKDHWTYVEIHHELSDDKEIQHKVFYLGICHPVKGVPNCNNNSGICYKLSKSENSSETLKTDLFYNAGQLSSPPEVIRRGLIALSYENGENCSNSFNKNKKFTTKLYLQCPEKADSLELGYEGPILLGPSSGCDFMFILSTVAACPKKVKSESNCTIQLSNSPYPLNIHGLYSPTFYNISGHNYSFEINICGQISNGTCSEKNVSVCDVSDRNNPKALAYIQDFSFKTNLINGVIYYSKGAKMRMYCDRKQYTPIMEYYREQSKGDIEHVFNIYSIILCSPEETDCVFEDDKLHVYDLRPLHKKIGNWEVIARENHEQKLFHLNICGPINNVGYGNCPEGPIGVCQTTPVITGARNFGYITSHPVVNKDQSISILYTGGESCREGVPYSSSRINLFCHSLDLIPTFVEVTDSCEYIFNWHTRAACPRNVLSKEGCKITDPLYGHVFDLTGLRKTDKDYLVDNGDVNFHINVCGPLIEGCIPENNRTSVCQLGEVNKSGGVYPSELVFNDGTLLMKFTNGSSGCDSGLWQSQILILCSYELEDESGPQYLQADANSCTHHFLWYTYYACPPATSVDCFVYDGEKLYDLTPLSSPKFNQIFFTANNTKKFVFNVCRSIVHSKESRCSYNAAACLIDKTHKNDTLSLGKITSSPILTSHGLMLTYSNGDPCNTTHNYATKIEFICSSHEYLSYPVLVDAENCLYLFEWSTIYACPVIEEPKEEFSNCTSVNTNTDYMFDMNPLRRDKPYELCVNETNLLLLNPCGEIKDPRCEVSGTGSCIVRKKGSSKSSLSAGVSNKNLHFSEWNIYLTYTNGDSCKDGKTWETTISFVCSEDERLSGPYLISEENCIYFINWYTELACEHLIKCSVESSAGLVDLSPLSRVDGNYMVINPDNPSERYYINVCKPLNPITGVQCHPSSSVCMFDNTTKKTSSLGYPFSNPVMKDNGVIGLRYAHGSYCDDFMMYTSTIDFKCNRSVGPGHPEFDSITHDCVVKFIWETYFACTDDHFDYGNQCHVIFDNAKTNLDLSPLYSENGHRVKFNDKIYLINVCGSVCGSAGVCTEEKENFGLSRYSQLFWEGSQLVVKYFKGDPCEGSMKTSSILFECNMDAGIGQPVASSLMKHSYCSVIFTWKTNVTCLDVIYGTPKPETSSSTEFPYIIPSTKSDNNISTVAPATSGDHTTGAVIFVVILLMVAIVVVMFLLVRRGSFQHTINRIQFFSKKGEQILILDDHL